MHAIAAGLLCAAGLIMIPCFIHWLITPPRKGLESSLESITERNRK